MLLSGSVAVNPCEARVAKAMRAESIGDMAERAVVAGA